MSPRAEKCQAKASWAGGFLWGLSLISLKSQYWLPHRVSSGAVSGFPQRKDPSSKAEVVMGTTSVAWDHEPDIISVPYCVSNTEQYWYRVGGPIQEYEIRKWVLLLIVLEGSCHTDWT